MIEGSQHHKSDEECPYSWLNEWLCEYVDGTMDPSLRNNFEEYLAANPELAEHVECLQRTRDLLCKQGADDKVPRSLQEHFGESGVPDAGTEHNESEDVANESNNKQTNWPIYQMMGGMVGMFVMGMAVGAFFLGSSPFNQSSSTLSDGPDQDVRIENATAPVTPPPAVIPFSNAPQVWGIESTDPTPVLGPDLQLVPTVVDTSIAPPTHLSDRR